MLVIERNFMYANGLGWIFLINHSSCCLLAGFFASNRRFSLYFESIYSLHMILPPFAAIEVHYQKDSNRLDFILFLMLKKFLKSLIAIRRKWIFNNRKTSQESEVILTQKKWSNWWKLFLYGLHKVFYNFLAASPVCLVVFNFHRNKSFDKFFHNFAGNSKQL